MTYVFSSSKGTCPQVPGGAVTLLSLLRGCLRHSGAVGHRYHAQRNTILLPQHSFWMSTLDNLLLLTQYCRTRGERAECPSPLLYGSKIPAIGFLPRMMESVVGTAPRNRQPIGESPFWCGTAICPSCFGEKDN